MKQITQTLANSIAKTLTEKLTDEIFTKEELLSQKASELYRNSLPKEIVKAHKYHGVFFKTAGSVRIYGNGFNGLTVPMNVYLPYDQIQYVPTLEPSPEEASELLTLYSAVDEAREKRDGLRREIKQALLTLKTRKNIEAHLPEALPLLPKEGTTTTALIPNLSGLRHQLSALTES